MLKQNLKTRQVNLKSLRIVSFQVKHLHLALPLEGVSKVIPQPDVTKGSQPFLGLAQVDDQEVIVLDVQQRILGLSVLDSEARGFLIVFKAEGKAYGITSPSLPMMQAVPVDAFKPIPADYRDRDALGIASQVAMMGNDESSQTMVFLLEPKLLIEQLGLS